MSAQDPLRRLAAQKDNPRRIGVDQFRDRGATVTGTPGEDSRVVEFTAEVPLLIRSDTPTRIALPAHETFTEDGTANTETLSLSNGLIDSDITESVVVFEGGVREKPVSVDFANNTVDVDTSGNGNTIDVFYTSDDAGLVAIEKEAPPAAGRTTSTLYEAPLGLLNQRRQYEQPEYIDGGEAEPTELLLADDFDLNVRVDVGYEVELGTINRANGQARATNAIISIPVAQGEAPIDGLARTVAQRMVM